MTIGIQDALKVRDSQIVAIQNVPDRKKLLNIKIPFRLQIK